MYNLLFWISVQVLLLWALHWATRGYRNRRVHKLIWGPSVLFDSEIRLGSACLSGRTVSRVSFFADRTPFLEEGGSRFGVFGEILYLLIWQGATYYVFQLLALGTGGIDALALSLPHVEPPELVEGVVAVDARSYLAELGALFSGMQWSQSGLWLFLYFSLGLFPCLALDFRQVRFAAILIAAVALVTAAMMFLGMRPGFLSRGWFLSWWVLPDFFRVYSLYVTLLGLTVVGHVGVRLIWGAMWRQAAAMGRKQEKGKTSKSRKKEAAVSS